MLISPEYQQLSRKLHENPQYGIMGTVFAPAMADLIQREGFKTLLDYGCGKGYLGLPLRGLVDLREYDPGVAGKDDRPVPAELVVCLDVLEHIEPDCLEAVLDDLKALTLRNVYLTVAHVPAMKVLPDGRNAHLIQEPWEWWEPKLRARWSLIEFKTEPQRSLFYGSV